MLPWAHPLNVTPYMTQASEPVCLLTRPAAEAERFATRVEAELGLRTVTSPLLCIEHVRVEVNWTARAGVILTSQHAAAQLTALCAPRDLTVFTAGERTARMAADQGFRAEPLGQDVESLLSALARRFSDQSPTGSFVYLRGEHTRGDLAARLRQRSVECEEAVVYQQLAVDLSAEAAALLAGDSAVVAPVFSPRTGGLLAKAAPSLAKTHIIAMSQNVATPFKGTNLSGLTIAATPTEQAMLAAMKQLRP